MYQYIGAIGALLILGSWLFQTIKEVKKHKSLVDLKFSLIYLVGVIFLSTYSYLVSDPVFLWLNIAILLTILGEIIYSVHVKKIHK